MKKKPGVDPKLKRLVIDSLRRHAWNMGVSHYKGDIVYMEEDRIEEGEGPTHASMTIDRRYLRAVLKIYPAAIKRWKTEGDRSIEDLIAHETAHILTEHLYHLATAVYKDSGEMEDAREALTESIGRLSVMLDKKERL